MSFVTHLEAVISTGHACRTTGSRRCALLVGEEAIDPDERVVVFNTGAAQK